VQICRAKSRPASLAECRLSANAKRSATGARVKKKPPSSEPRPKSSVPLFWPMLSSRHRGSAAKPTPPLRRFTLKQIDSAMYVGVDILTASHRDARLHS
jgi:hypothetical protein